MTTVRAVAVPSELPADARLTGAHYRDAFAARVSDPAAREAEDWMRRALEGAPAPLRLFVRVGWRVVLGLRAVRDAPNILGWRIVSAEPRLVVLEQSSWLLSARLLLVVDNECIVWVTFVRHDKAPSRLVWSVLGLLHRPIVRYVLARAVDA